MRKLQAAVEGASQQPLLTPAAHGERSLGSQPTPLALLTFAGLVQRCACSYWPHRGAALCACSSAISGSNLFSTLVIRISASGGLPGGPCNSAARGDLGIRLCVQPCSIPAPRIPQKWETDCAGPCQCWVLPQSQVNTIRACSGPPCQASRGLLVHPRPASGNNYPPWCYVLLPSQLLKITKHVLHLE